MQTSLETIVSTSARVRNGSESQPRDSDGGGEGTRTPDPMVANHVLCQLSYTPRPDFEFLKFEFIVGGPGWIRTTDLTLIRGAL